MYDSAYQNAYKALELSNELGFKFYIIAAFDRLLWIDEARGNYRDALEHYKMKIQYKDSLFNEENSKQLASLKIQFETEKKDQEIELLNKDNSIKALQLEQQETSLRTSFLESEKNRNELMLMTTSRELQELQLAKTQEELDRQHLLSEAQAAEMALISKDKELKEQQLARQKLQRNVVLITMAFLFVLGLLLFRSLHLRKKLEKQSAIIQERKRISADLHDDIGTGLSKISLLSELIRDEAKTPEAKNEADKIVGISKELLQSIGEIIWALNANNDHLENLVAYIRRYAAEYFENSDMKLNIIAPASVPRDPISGECRRNIFYAVKEALHNIVKHARASKTEIRFLIENHHLSVIIKDNGTGLPEGELNRFGNGIRNMKSRMEKIHGKFSIENDRGTKITLSLAM
jgi:signal transduction histidine kinase